METKLIAINLIDRDTNQPRNPFLDEDIKELAESMTSDGPDQDITVMPVDGRFQIVTGERRLRAAKLKGVTHLNCKVRLFESDKERQLAQLRENIQRKDLSALEKANGYKRLHDQGMTEREIAHKVGISQTTIHNYLNLATNLHDLLHNQIGKGQLSLSDTQALEIARIKEKDKQWEVAEVMVRNKMRDQHQIHQYVDRVNIAMDHYSNIPMQSSKRKGESEISLESIADGVMTVQNNQSPNAKPYKKKKYYEQVLHRVTELKEIIPEYMAGKIPSANCLTVQAELEDLKVMIDNFLIHLPEYRSPLFDKTL